MDHLAVACAGFGTKGCVLFQYQAFVPGRSQRPGARQPDHTGANNNGVDPVHADQLRRGRHSNQSPNTTIGRDNHWPMLTV